MNYRDVYFSRVTHLGDTTAEHIRNAGIRSFDKWLAESPHTIRNLSVERGIYFDGIILTSKDKEYEKIMFLEVANHVSIRVGDLMNWVLEDGQIEKWLIIQEEKKVNGTFKTFWIVRCNYLAKWIDGQGHLQQSWCYFVSSLDSKIKGNFRTWNNLITPQANKYAEILMPCYPILRGTNFILEEESWTTVEYDHTSVPGVIYLSLTENKVNLIYDDLVNDIADLDKLANYTLAIPEEKQQFQINSPININFILMKNGIPFTSDVKYISNNLDVAKVINGQLQAIGTGEAEIVIQLADYPEITQSVTIEVINEENNFSAFIDGADKIKLDRKNIYIVKTSDNSIPEVEFTLNSTDLAQIISASANQCEIKANNKNKLGSFILNASFNGNTYSKEVLVIPLW